MDICSFTKISRDSSTNIEKNPLSRSLMMTLDVSRAIAFTMSFWISEWLNLQFFQEFCYTSLIDSLWSPKNCKSSRKFPLSLEPWDSSWPQKANPLHKRNFTQSTIAFNWIRYSILSCFACLTKTLWICCFSFSRSSPFLTA